MRSVHCFEQMQEWGRTNCVHFNSMDNIMIVPKNGKKMTESHFESIIKDKQKERSKKLFTDCMTVSLHVSKKVCNL